MAAKKNKTMLLLLAIGAGLVVLANKKSSGTNTDTGYVPKDFETGTDPYADQAAYEPAQSKTAAQLQEQAIKNNYSALSEWQKFLYSKRKS